MNIDKLLDLSAATVAYTAEGTKFSGQVSAVSGDETFLYKPERPIQVEAGRLLKISDGRDSILTRVLSQDQEGILLYIESQLKPSDERRQDVRINDKIYLRIRLIGHAWDYEQGLQQSLGKIRNEKLIIDSFLKGRYGNPEPDEGAAARAAVRDRALWEVNRKLDLLIHMMLSEDFKQLMYTTPVDANISASGIRFISRRAFDVMDIIEVGMILPMTPLLFLRIPAQVIRVKTLRAGEDGEPHSIVARYLDIDQDMKEDLIHYLFKRQRQILRNRQELATD